MNELQRNSIDLSNENDSSALFESFIEYLDIGEQSNATYTAAMRQFFRWIQENGIQQPDRSDIIRYRNQLREEKKPATVQLYMTALRVFFSWTEDERLYPNVARHIKGAKIDRQHKKDALAAAQIARILREFDRNKPAGIRDYALVYLMATTGIRDVEAQRANVGDLGTAGGSSVLYVQGKGQEEKARYVKIAAPVEDALRDYLRVRGSLPPEDPLFVSISNHNSGGRLTTRSISRIVKTAFRAAGYDSERLTAHSLRHSAATINLRSGGSLEETQEMLRHSSIATTMIYNHALAREGNNSELRVADQIQKNLH